MKRSERSLLDNLRGKTPLTSEKSLQNVRNALGSLRHIKGNPLSKNEISINVDVFFCNPALNILIAPAAVAAVNQTPLPGYFFGLNDSYSGIVKSQFIEPINPNWFLLQQGYWGYNIFAGTPAPFAINLQNGDYFIEYAPAVGAANLRAMVRVRCENVGYSTLIHSLMSDIIYVDAIRYSVNVGSILQFTHPLKIASLSGFGKLETDSIDPRLYILPTSPQQTISDIPIKMPFDKSIIITTQLDFSCQHFNWILFVERIERLTLR